VCGYWWPISLFPWEWSYNWVDSLLTNECNTRKCLRIILGFTHLIVPFLMTTSSRKYISDTFVPFTLRKEAHPFRDLFILRCYVDGIVLGLEFMALVIWMSYLNLNTVGNWLYWLIWNVSCSDYCVFKYRVRHKSINAPLSNERLVGGLQDGGRGTHVTHFVQLYSQPLYTASQVRTTCRS